MNSRRNAVKAVFSNTGKEIVGYEAVEGKCPTCNKRYRIKANGALRKHGKGYCSQYDQLPREIVPAIIEIARLGSEDNGNN